MGVGEGASCPGSDGLACAVGPGLWLTSISGSACFTLFKS